MRTSSTGKHTGSRGRHEWSKNLTPLGYGERDFVELRNSNGVAAPRLDGAPLVPTKNLSEGSIQFMDKVCVNSEQRRKLVSNTYR
jgi:hypothetical protein